VEETHEQITIRLLTLLANSIEPVSSDETWLLSDIAVLAELETGGFVSAGDVVRSGQGQVIAIVCVSINISGRKYLIELIKESEANTSVGFIKQHRFAIYKWVFGIVGSIIVGLVLWHLTREKAISTDTNNQQVGILLTKGYDNEFNDMTRKRALAANAIQEYLAKGNWNLVTNNTDALDAVLGFFDTLGYSLEKKQVDSDAVYEYFCDDILSYYQGSREYIEKVQISDPTELVHLKPLYETMRTLAATQPPKVNRSEIYFTKPELMKFFQSETNSVDLKDK
jgi:hypothetical protein